MARQGSTRAGIGSIGGVSRGFFEDALAISPLTHRPGKSRIDSFGLENILGSPCRCHSRGA
ncbi:hypothetical protein CN167_30405 [Sinorhizobium medicae]|nr:hypothetical protein CN167_30405 [Sinorhizobium medicae]RVK22178.1 hypothetical protein CN165_05230 [Sinorhizobium medicae]